MIAMEEADVIIFLVDGKTGITIEDELLAKTLLRSSKPVILAVNKIDNIKQSLLSTTLQPGLTNRYLYRLSMDECRRPAGQSNRLYKGDT